MNYYNIKILVDDDAPIVSYHNILNDQIMLILRANLSTGTNKIREMNVCNNFDEGSFFYLWYTYETSRYSPHDSLIS